MTNSFIFVLFLFFSTFSLSSRHIRPLLHSQCTTQRPRILRRAFCVVSLSADRSTADAPCTVGAPVATTPTVLPAPRRSPTRVERPPAFYPRSRRLNPRLVTSPSSCPCSRPAHLHRRRPLSACVGPRMRGAAPHLERLGLTAPYHGWRRRMGGGTCVPTHRRSSCPRQPPNWPPDITQHWITACVLPAALPPCTPPTATSRVPHTGPPQGPAPRQKWSHSHTHAAVWPPLSPRRDRPACRFRHRRNERAARSMRRPAKP